MNKIYILLITIVALNAGEIQNLRLINDDNNITKKEQTVIKNHKNSIKIRNHSKINKKKVIKQKKIKKITKIKNKTLKKKLKVNKYLLQKNIEIKQLQLQLMELTQKVVKLQKYSEYLLKKIEQKEQKIKLINKTKK